MNKIIELESNEIKSCPFCDGNDVKVRFEDNRRYCVVCSDCGSMGPSIGVFGTQEQIKSAAIRKFNARNKIERDKYEIEQFLESVENFNNRTCYCDSCIKVRITLVADRINLKIQKLIDEDEKNNSS